MRQRISERYNYLPDFGYFTHDERLQKTYGISYSISGVHVLLRRLGFVYKKPKHFPGKADRQAQEQFIEKYSELRKNKGKNDVFLFMDGCRPIHNSIMGPENWTG